MRTSSARVCVWFLLVLCPALAAARVRVVVGADGRKQIIDDGAAARPRASASGSKARYATTLRQPEAHVELMISRHSDAQQLDPKLVKALIQAESNFNERAVSRKGAMGLMQLMPDTARQLKVSDPFDPDQNVRGGTTYLRRMLDRFAGRLEFAVAAYNAGPGAVERHGGIPPFRETRDYVRKVLALYRGEDVGLPLTPNIQLTPTGPRRKPQLVRNAQNRLVLTTSLNGTR
jgi:soluble lytic murein transglycosylase-like protein